MLNFVVILLPLFFVQSVQSISLNGNLPVLGIVGGNEAKPNKFGYQVSFEYNDRHVCGGSIISPKHIITAAHCIADRNAEMMAIRAGSIVRELGGQLVPVKRYINHPSYNDITNDYDISIVILKEPLQINNKSVKIVKLPKKNEKITAKSGVTSGWGQTQEDLKLLPKKLQFLELPILDKTYCEKVMEATDQMICAGYLEGGKDTCTSDSGGPLVADKKLIGVVSWGYGCGRPNSPGIYVKVSAVRDWIKENTKV